MGSLIIGLKKWRTMFEKDNNEQIPEFLDFLIDQYSFKPHKNTENEFFYIRKDKKFTCLYSPLTQNLIIQPKEYNHFQTEKVISEANFYLNSLLWDFFLNKGKDFDSLWVEIYDPSNSKIGKKVIFQGKRKEQLALVSNYKDQVKTFKKYIWLKKACFMSHMLDAFPR